MKLLIKNNDTSHNKRLNIFKKEDPCLDSEWHYHPEYELLYISSSFGIRFVGDNVSEFNPGDLVLVGSYLPHLWRNDPTYYRNDSDKKVKTIVAKFTKDFIGEGTFDNPEFNGISKLLSRSKYGLHFSKKVSQDLKRNLLEFSDLSAPEQSIHLLSILYKLSNTEDYIKLSTTDMRQCTAGKPERIDRVIKFLSDHYAKKITLEDVAKEAYMTTNSFCRFFKKMTNKSFTQFLNEIRIRNAARLLVQENTPISSICYTVGYNSITNFNKQFKQVMGATPKEYRASL
jgi:AraC-like DNA-binding protein